MFSRSEIVPGLQLALRAGIAAALSVSLARLLGLQYPIYALIAAVLVTDFSPAQSRSLGVQRLAATVLGAACALAVRIGLDPSAATIGLSIVLAMTVCHTVRLAGGVKAAGYIAGIVMLEHDDDPLKYALFRLAETALGIGIAWLISFVPRLIRVEEASPGESGHPPLRR